MDLNSFLNKDKELITTSYFNMQEAATKLYGEKTVILMEIGSFYEIYESDKIGVASEISEILNIILTRKNKNIKEISEKNPALCGIPSVSLDKHLDKLTNLNEWTIILVNQEGTPPNIKRKISKIISPGTNIDYLKNSNYNFIASIFLEKTKENIIYAGLSLIDLSTGKVLVYENYGTKQDKKLALDEISNIIKIHNTSEIVFTFIDFENSEKDNIINELSNNISYSIKSEKDIKNYLKISYQNELLKSIFDINTFLSPIEYLDLERTPNALNSLTILLNFIIEHNMNIVRKLNKPLNINNQNYLYLGNHALEQLNIINHNKRESLSFIVNKGISAIGKRFINDQLINPLIDKKEILNRYNLSKFFLNKSLRENVSIELKSIYDIERLWRKIELNTINPQELYNLYLSIKNILTINSYIKNIDKLNNFLNLNIQELENFTNSIEESFYLDKLQLFSLNNINSIFIKQGLYPELDSLGNKLKENFAKINKLALSLNSLFEESDIDLTKNPLENKFSHIVIGYNDTEGFYFEITNKRLESLNNYELRLYEIFEEKMTTKSLKNSKKFYLKSIQDISNEILLIESKLINLNKKLFLDFINKIEFKSFEDTVFYISYIEFLINNALLKENLAYNEPEILENKDNFIEAKNLRHAIIEQIQDNEIYIPNDIILGNSELAKNKDFIKNIYQNKKEINGYLLYGLNSSGKSSQMKSLGIAIILAQAGFYVPAEEFRFTLFKKLFTRITGSDNIYKGLSTFAIEMLELKNILNRADKNTLVLGDEIAHGTETISGLSIVASAVSELASKKAYFLFATHLHQLSEIEEISSLNTVTNIHLEVYYDEEKEILIYNRKIKPGKGSSIYGLEFAKFMDMDKSFLKKAYAIRNKLSKDLNIVESIARNKTRYNKDKIISNCEICGNYGEEVHHINEQKKANKNGVIKHFKKNHKQNLINLCKSCHEKVHKGLINIEGYKKTSEGLKLIYKKENV